jgi:hypothetical protein
MDTTTTLSTTFPEKTQEQYNPELHSSIKRVKIHDYAYKTAGLNEGNPASLKANLQWITEGHIVDEGYSEQEHLLGKKKVENSIRDKELEKQKFESEKETAENVKIPAVKEQMKETKEEIQQVKIDSADKKIASDFQSIRYYTYVTLVVFLSVYLVFFYASAINSAFFRNASTLISTAGQDITMLLDSIFDTKGIFVWNTSLLFTYLGAFLFFGIGLLPHGILSGDNKNRKVYAGLLIAAAFIADAALAYKIDKGIHDLKVMAGLPDADWRFYSSINFYLVLLFGFCAYLVWGMMYELTIKEKSKKNTDIKAQIIIADLKKQLNEQKSELQDLQVRVSELEGDIEGIKIQLAILKKDLESAMVNPDELKRNLTSFYKGWLQFLNGCEGLDVQRGACTDVFTDFMNSLFIKQNQSLN